MPTPWTWAKVAAAVGIPFPLVLAPIRVAVPAFAGARFLTRGRSAYRVGTIRATGLNDRVGAILGGAAVSDDATARQWQAMFDARRVHDGDRAGGKKGPPPDEF